MQVIAAIKITNASTWFMFLRTGGRTILFSQRETSQTFLESRECWRELPAAKGVLRGETSKPDWSCAGRR
jgi:hypothetical protein